MRRLVKRVDIIFNYSEDEIWAGKGVQREARQPRGRERRGRMEKGELEVALSGWKDMCMCILRPASTMMNS